MARIRSDLQIEKGLPAGNKVLAKPDGKTEVVQIEPYKVSPTTWVADDAGIYENVPGQFEIPSLPFAKDVDTVFSRGGKVFKYNAGGGYFELVFDSVVKVIEASENDIATFAANSGNYTFTSGDFIAIPDGFGGYDFFIYNGGTKTDTNSYLHLNISQVDWSQVNNTPTTLAGYGITDAATSAQGALADTAIQPGDNVSDLTNDSGFVDSAGAASAAPVQSVNSQTGSVVLDADDIDDSTTVNKFVTAAEKSDIASAVQPSDLSTVATTGAYSDLSGTPTLGTAASADTGDFATSAQGSLADTAIQPNLQDISGADWVLDEDDMISDSDTKVPTQQSVKAYVDANAGGSPVNLFTDDLTLGADRVHDLGDNEFVMSGEEGSIEMAFHVGTDKQGGLYVDHEQVKIISRGTGSYTAGFRALNFNGPPVLEISTGQDLSNTFNAGKLYLKAVNQYGLVEYGQIEIPEYASDADADNDSDLAANAPYAVTGDRMVRTKSSASPFNPSYGYQTLTDAANISWDMDLGEMAEVTLGGNRTLDNPTNLKKGTYSLLVKQDASGGRTLDYGTAFKWPGGVPPDLTSDPNAVDLLTFVSDGTNLYGAITSDYS